jgi:predicted nucleic acid-binding protein
MSGRFVAERKYVADTVALAKYLDNTLPTKADGAFKESENGDALILIPEIVIGEFIYICLKGRLRSDDPKSLIQELLDEVAAAAGLLKVGMTNKSWAEFMDSTISELHDRMILAIAKAEEVEAIITSDEELASSGFRTIW